MRAFTKSRKGIAGAEETRNIILAVVGMIVVISFIGYFFFSEEGIAEAASKTACHDALVYSAALMKQFPAGEYVKEWPSPCKTEERVVEEKEHAKMTKRVVDLMADCWYAMGEGKIRPFDIDLVETSTKCFVCYTLTAPNLEKQILSGDILAEMGKKTMFDPRITYADYLNTGGVAEVAPDKIDSGDIYAIYYYNSEAVMGDGRDQGILIKKLNTVVDKCDIREGEAS